MEYARLSDGPAAAVRSALAGTARGIAAPTSGSTGAPREVLLSGDALRAGALATEERLGGPGHWLLATPATRIAGAMVLVRAEVAGTTVTELRTASFDPVAFAEAAQTMPADARRYVSLVPTQVTRLQAHPAGREALASFTAVLVGGAAPGADLPPHAVVTYGMTETAGGCVYDGVPLAGVSVRTGADGRIQIAGPMLADGYSPADDFAWVTEDGTRWFVTSDLGSWRDGVLTVDGRADDVIISGGVNVHPAAVERAISEVPEIAEVVVVGVPDDQWGQRVTALVSIYYEADPVSLGDLREALREQLDAASLPRAIVHVDTLPRLASGKIDRRASLALALTKETP